MIPLNTFLKLAMYSAFALTTLVGSQSGSLSQNDLRIMKEVAPATLTEEEYKILRKNMTEEYYKDMLTNMTEKQIEEQFGYLGCRSRLENSTANVTRIRFNRKDYISRDMVEAIKDIIFFIYNKFASRGHFPKLVLVKKKTTYLYPNYSWSVVGYNSRFAYAMAYDKRVHFDIQCFTPISIYGYKICDCACARPNITIK